MTKATLFWAPSLAAFLLAVLVSAGPAAPLARCHLEWRVVPPPRLLGAWLGPVDAVDRSDVWVVGVLTKTLANPGPVLYERWNGRRWHLGRLPVQAFARPLSLSATSNRDVWIVGETTDFKPLILHYDGHNWTSLAAPSAPNEGDRLYDVAALAPNDVWAVGQRSVRGVEGHSALALHWDGSRWASVDAPAGVENLFALAAVSPRDIWAVAPAQEDPAVGFRVIVAHWDGTSWRELNTKLRAVDLAGITAVSAKDVWAVGSTSGTGSRGVVVRWNGRAFRLVHREGPLGSDFFFGIAAAGRQAWALGDADTEHRDGRRWRRTQIKGVSFGGVDALSPRNVWAVGGNRRGPVVYHYACR
jgi:hypothetical protein